MEIKELLFFCLKHGKITGIVFKINLVIVCFGSAPKKGGIFLIVKCAIVSNLEPRGAFVLVLELKVSFRKVF